jgi:hypothetical protein
MSPYSAHRSENSTKLHAVTTLKSPLISTDRITVNDKMKRRSKKFVVTYFQAQSQHFPHSLRKITEYFSQDSVSLRFEPKISVLRKTASFST